MTHGAEDPSDEALAARVRDGDTAAFEALVRRHERPLYNLAYRMLGRREDARDAVQDAFVSCYRRIATFRGDARFSTWLHRIAANACYDIFRKHVPEPVDPHTMAAPLSADPADRVAAHADVQRALLALPAEFRVALVMHDILDIPVEEVARILDTPVGTIKSRLHRGRAQLGRTLHEEPVPLAAPSNPPTP